MSLDTKGQKSLVCEGVIRQLRGQNFAIFWHPTPCVDSFFTLIVNKNRLFWPPSPRPPHFAHIQTKFRGHFFYEDEKLFQWAQIL